MLNLMSVSIIPVCPWILRVSTVQRALPLPNHALREPTAHAQLSVMGLSVPLVAEASTALVLDSQSPLEAAKSVTTAEQEPSPLYGNVYWLFATVCPW